MRAAPPECPVPGAFGCVDAVGPVDAPILLVGEAAGKQEAFRGIPFVPEAPAGSILEKAFRALGVNREDFRIANCVRCHPPGDYLIGTRFENAALRHCRGQLERVLSEPHKVVVPLGGTALRSILDLPKRRGKESAKVADFHGQPLKDPQGRFWVVPTFHPSFLAHGGLKLFKTFCFDLQRAIDCARGVYEEDLPTLVIDPPIDWFEEWAETYLRAVSDGFDPWLDVDIETDDKVDDEGELKPGEGSAEITRINLACSLDEGITVRWIEPYIGVIKRVLASPGIKVLHNAPFDVPRLRINGAPINGTIYDSMDAWHVFQSSLPKGLGFVGAFYSKTPPFKHLGNKSTTYCAMDPVIGLRTMYGVAQDLVSEGLWDVFIRRMVILDNACFRPAEEIGLLLDRPGLVEFTKELVERCEGLEGEINQIVPQEIKPLSAPLVNRPEDEEEILEKNEARMVQVCKRCGESEVSKAHRCEDLKKAGKKAPLGGVSHPESGLDGPLVVLEERCVRRYYRRKPFKPSSWQQVMAYVKHRGHKPGTAKKTKKDSVDKKTLKRLVKTGDPLYPKILEHRMVAKMEGTYGTAMLKKMDSEGRIHTTFTNTPSTLRKSSAGPCLQNLANHVLLANGFRRRVVAKKGCKLISADYSGIEAVNVGYFSGDPDYIRLAKLGVHAYLTSFLPEVNLPADLKWSDSDLREHFKMLKGRFDPEYNQSKRCVHGSSYGLTPHGMSDYYPDVFPKRSDAEKIQRIFFEVCPKLKPWHAHVRKLAHEQHYLGGPPQFSTDNHTAQYWELINRCWHPFGYKHWFWEVLKFQKAKGGKWKESLGEDAKRCIAFPPQSTAMGIIQEAMIRLFVEGEGQNWIGDAYYGQTPLRAQIHDDLTLEVPDERGDEIKAILAAEMMRPIREMPLPPEWGLGDFLTIGVEMKEGRNWAPFNAETNPEGMRVVSGVESLAADVYREEEDEDDEDQDSMSAA